MNNVIEISGLCKNYDEFALKDVSFTLAQGSIMGFVGQNGAGKTTTIKSILNMVNPDKGLIKLFGSDSFSKDAIGIVMDQPFFVADWTLANVEQAVSAFYSEWRKDIYTNLLRKFGMDSLKKVKELSRGMEMKLMIAIAMSHNAQLLIMDEPTSGLDPVARDELMDLLLDFVEDGKKSVLFSTHITSDLEKIADSITFIRNGSIVFSGSKRELLSAYVMLKSNSEELADSLKKMIIGYRRFPAGFEGLAKKDSLFELPENIEKSVASLDDIVVYLSREGRSNE